MSNDGLLPRYRSTTSLGSRDVSAGDGAGKHVSAHEEKRREDAEIMHRTKQDPWDKRDTDMQFSHG